ncbi:MAG: hypothetical protein GTO63_01475 [Anaerolineae bacterium]|nr:hypothetical protein [Anaerolineae bacterium]NIN93718.1 hypothetical protein [Anaerolineae bacterium]NIQ78131.1 hypothetical protein [Anaerolineae bacterium]
MGSNFPSAKLKSPELPVDLTLWCWSPFILHDLRHSSYPVAMFEAESKNTGRESAELVRFYGTSYGKWLQKLTAGGTEGLSVGITIASRLPLTLRVRPLLCCPVANVWEPTTYRLVANYASFGDTSAHSCDTNCQSHHLDPRFASQMANRVLDLAS